MKLVSAFRFSLFALVASFWLLNSAQAIPYVTVIADTNGVLKAPTNFFSANGIGSGGGSVSNAIATNAALPSITVGAIAIPTNYNVIGGKLSADNGGIYSDGFQNLYAQNMTANIFFGGLVGNADSATAADVVTGLQSNKISAAITNFQSDVSLAGIFTGDGSGLTGLQSTATNARVALVASNLFNFPKEIYIVAGVYGMAYLSNPTNSGINSAGQFYTANPYNGNGTLWSTVASNVLQSDYGLTVNVDSSISHPDVGEPQDLGNGVANGKQPPFDAITPTLYWLHQRSPNVTGTNKLIYLHAPQAGIESASYTAAQAFQIVTNLAKNLERDGWTVALGTFIYNYDYWVAYTNQTSSGIQCSNYDLAVRNQSRWPYVDFFKVTTNWAAYNSFTGNTNYYAGNNHIGYWTGQVIGTNFVRYLITNLLVTAPKQFPPLANNNVKSGWIGWMAGGSWIPNYTNPAPAFGMATNASAAGWPQTNGYPAVNMTVSNLLPNTRYEWNAAFHLQAGNPANSGGRWDFRTDYVVRDWEYSGRTIYPSSGDILGSKVNGDSGANNSVVGGQRNAGAGQANVGANLHGSFTTGTNVTALQMWYAPETTNVSSVIKSGFMRVWPATTP